MRVVHQPYPSVELTIDIVTMESGERVPFKSSQSEASFGGTLSRGNITQVSGAPWADNEPESGVWCARGQKGAWRADISGAAMFEAGPDGAEFVCLGGTPRAVAVMDVTGAFAVPAGTEVICAAGTVSVDGVNIPKGKMYGRRNEDKEGTGNGRVLLLT